MKRGDIVSLITIDIPRRSTTSYAEEVKADFAQKGWPLVMTGYLLQSAGSQVQPKIRTLVFQQPQ